MRYFKIPLCPKFEQCEKTKMPPGGKNDSNWHKLTQMQTQVVLYKIEQIICTKWLKDRCRDLKMGSIAGNDQNTLLYDFMQKLKDRSSNVCSWSTVENTVNLKVLENSREIWRSIFRSKMRVWQLPLFKFLCLESQETESLAWHDEDT